MRKVILNLAVSLDGFIEGPNGEYDWCFIDQDYGMSAFMKRIDTIFLGRKSYEQLISSDKNPFPDKKKFIFSSTLINAGKNFQIISGDLKKEVEAIKNRNGKDVWLFGGAALTESMINEELVDELQLAVHPILLGCGKQLFGNLRERIQLELMDVKTYSSGLVQLMYTFDENRTNRQ
jgi:dihydrofolate reductase